MQGNGIKIVFVRIRIQGKDVCIWDMFDKFANKTKLQCH